MAAVAVLTSSAGGGGGGGDGSGVAKANKLDGRGAETQSILFTYSTAENVNVLHAFA